jgi:nitrogenase molybdenum-iron protein beta chain
LTRQIETTLEVIEGELFVVATACQTDIIGDDVPAILAAFPQYPLIFIEAGGFKGDSYLGYAKFMEALFRQYLQPVRENKKQVNLLGLVPGYDPFFRGDLEEIRRLLELIGLEVTSFLTGEDSLEKIRQARGAAHNLIFNAVHGALLGQELKQAFNQKFSVYSLPIGAKGTSEFLRSVGKLFKVPSPKVEEVIARESGRYYRYLDRIADLWTDADFQNQAVVVTNSTYARPLACFLDQEAGWLVDLVYVTDQLTEEAEEKFRAHFFQSQYTYQPQLYFQTSAQKIQTHLHQIRPQFLAGDYLQKLEPVFILGSTNEAKLADSLGGTLLSVSYPLVNRAVITKGYAGYNGGLRLLEDLTEAQVAKRL